jgi:type VI protein secretion system component Hcp
MIRRTFATVIVIAAFGVAAGTAAADSKQPAKVQVHDISIVHYVDKASPVLM